MLITALTRLFLVAACVLTLSNAAYAVEDVVTPKATPMPKAGPTMAAAQQFCGEQSDKAAALFERYSKSDKLKEVYRSNDYVAYGDDKDAASAMYTFTTTNHPAHPAAVCRKLEKVGDQLVVKMVVVCDGKEGDCNKLRNDFNVMMGKMQAEVDQKIAADKK